MLRKEKTQENLNTTTNYNKGPDSSWILYNFFTLLYGNVKMVHQFVYCFMLVLLIDDKERLTTTVIKGQLFYQ